MNVNICECADGSRVNLDTLTKKQLTSLKKKIEEVDVRTDRPFVHDTIKIISCSIYIMSIRGCTRCGASTRRGTRCKLRTCLYSEFCHAHTKQLFDLALRASHIQNSGKGLFTLKAIPNNANIANYTGDGKSLEEYNANPSDYAVAISRGRLIDAASTQSAIGRYANDCRNVNRQAGQCNGPNSRFVINNRVLIPQPLC